MPPRLHRTDIGTKTIYNESSSPSDIKSLNSQHNLFAADVAVVGKDFIREESNRHGREYISKAYELNKLGLECALGGVWKCVAEFSADQAGANLDLRQAPEQKLFSDPGPKDAANAAEKKISAEAIKGIRSLEKRITEHEQKLAAFRASPTVRPGMEGQPRHIIEAAQQSRIRHLEKEIQTFKENIEKLRNVDG